MATRTRDWLLNAALVVFGGLLVVLAYGLLLRVTRPADVPARLPEASAAADSTDIPNVEVLNATAVEGLAAQTRRYLIEHNVDVVRTDNAPEGSVRRSSVVSRTGELDAARRVARMLGIREHQVSSDPQADLSVDATVLLGSDYATLLPFLPDSTR